MADDLFADFRDVTPEQLPAADFHMHTDWTDGRHSVAEMHAAAIEYGLKTVLFSEHARHTSGNWYFDFAEEVRSLPQEPCRALVGVEVKVTDFEGNIDSTPEIVAAADLVMASVHRFPGTHGEALAFDAVSPDEAVQIEFDLANAVLGNSAVDILGHPFGMCYRRFRIQPPIAKIRALIERAATTGVAFEVNSQYHPDPWQLVDWCSELGAQISLGSNAHCREEIGQIVRVLRGEETPWSPSASS